MYTSAALTLHLSATNASSRSATDVVVGAPGGATTTKGGGADGGGADDDEDDDDGAEEDEDEDAAGTADGVAEAFDDDKDTATGGLTSWTGLRLPSAVSTCRHACMCVGDKQTRQS